MNERLELLEETVPFIQEIPQYAYRNIDGGTG